MAVGVASQDGVRHEGLVITKIHFNVRYMLNYMRLEQGDVRHSLLDWRSRTCGCDMCGGFVHPNDPEWMSWVKSGRGKYYRTECMARVRGAVPSWL